ncbi:Bug family tripartite tricarboxylate transporter substrate binding protein [Sediminicoccus sp. BL-A-41-H5]|uniref:Bug family tripartite tricarboxylate transporter substrate binding protein n=1 Tax=Sediminicoccus sp. BL-A-41-H5 TaxID=3421106 RepID=UPI003D67C458
MPSRRHLLASGIALLPAPAIAQSWRPTRPIRLIVPFAPGGSNDIVGRIVGEAAGNILGQPVVIENRAGAGSVIGAEAAARAAPDGQTLLINSSLPTVPAIVARVPYNTLEDFTGIAVAGFSPYVLVVNPQVPARTAQELVALMRATPQNYHIAATGNGSGVHVAAELFRSVARVESDVVHYRGGGPSVAALVSGEVRVGLPTMASSIGQVRGGALRALAVLAESRTPVLPDVPTTAEAGLRGVVLEEYFPIVAPAQTPPPVVAALSEAFRAAVQQTAPRLAELAGVTPRAGYETPAQVMGLVRASIAQQTAILRAAGVQPE